jgi:hypothetical protein
MACALGEGHRVGAEVQLAASRGRCGEAVLVGAEGQQRLGAAPAMRCNSALVSSAAVAPGGMGL